MARRAPRRRRRAVSGDSWRRIARAGFQAGIGTIIVQGIQVFFPDHVTAAQINWINGLFVFLVGVTQNGLEDAGMPAMLKKSPAEPPADDLTADEVAAIRSALADR
jgi:hypothetical protein